MKNIQEIQPVDVYGLGHCCVDYLAVLDPYPQKGRKGYIVDSMIVGGGPVPTALQVVAKYGKTARFCGKVGDDEDGRIVIKGLKKFGIDTSPVVTDSRVTTARAYIWIDSKEGTRTVALDVSLFSWLEPDQVNVELPGSCRIFLCDGRATEASFASLKAAKNTGVTTVLDAGAVRPRFNEILPLCDYVIVSRDLADTFSPGASPEQLAQKLVDRGAGVAVVTIGEGGVIWNSGKKRGSVKSIPVNTYDSTGAGDVLHGAFIYGLLNEWEFEDCLRFGNITAALSCRKLSGVGGIPELNEVLELVQS